MCSTRCVTLLHCVALCGSVCGLVGLSSYGENSAYPPHLPQPPLPHTTPSTSELPLNKYKYKHIQIQIKKILPIPPPHLLLQQPPQHTTIVGKSVFASGNRFFEAQLS